MLLCCWCGSSRYSNLYFSEDAFPGCEEAEVEGCISQSVRAGIEKRYVIRPVVERHFWTGERASMEIDRGPCES